MASRKKKDQKTTASGKDVQTQNYSPGAVAMVDEKKNSKKLFSFSGSRKKSKDIVDPSPGKEAKKSKGGGKGKEKVQSEPTVSEVVQLEGSPGPSRHGLSQVPVSPVKTTTPGALEPSAASPMDASSRGVLTSTGEFDDLEPKHQTAQPQGIVPGIEPQELIDLRKAVVRLEIEKKRIMREKDDLAKQVEEYQEELATAATTSRPFTSGDGGKVEELKKHNDRLEQDLTLIRNEMSACQEQKKVAETELADVKNNLEKLEQKMLYQSQLVLEAEEYKRVQEEKLREAEEKFALAIEQQRDAVDQEKHRLLNESRDLFNKLQETEKEAIESAEQVVKFTMKIEQDELEHQALLTELQKERENSAQLKKHLKEKEEHVDECDKQLQVKEEEAVKLAEQLHKVEQEMVATSQRVHEQEVEVGKMRANLQEVEKEAIESAEQVMKLTVKMEQKDLQHQALLIELQKEKDASVQLRNQLKESEAKIDEHAQGNEEEKVRLVEQLQNANEEIARNVDQLEEQKKAVSSLTQQLESVHKAKMEMEREVNVLREEQFHRQPVRLQDNLGVLSGGQDGAGASPHSSLNEHQKTEEWLEVLAAKDAEIKQLQEESCKLRADLDNEKLVNSLLNKTTMDLEEKLGKDQHVPNKPEELPDQFQQMLHTQGPVVGRARSTSPAYSDMKDREIMQHLQKKLEDEIKVRTSLEQEVRDLQDQLAHEKESSKKRQLLTATPLVDSQADNGFSLGMAAKIQESEENVASEENIATEPQPENDRSQQQYLVQMEKQSHQILALRQEIKNKDVHLEVSEDQLEAAKTENQELMQRIESLEAKIAVLGGEGKSQNVFSAVEGTESDEGIGEQLIKSQQDVKNLEHLCHEKEQAIRHLQRLVEHNKNQIENMGKTIVELSAEKSHLEEVQGELSMKVAQIEELDETIALKDNSIVALEEQARNLLKEKQQAQESLQDREREVGRVRDEMECIKMQAIMYEEDFQQERKDREKAHGMLEELRDKLTVEKNMYETQMQACNLTITKLRDQIEDNSRKAEVSRRLQQKNERLQEQLHELEEERDTSMQQVRSYKKQADGFKTELEEQRKRAESLQQQLEHLVGFEAKANSLLAEKEKLEKHMQSQRSASAAERRRVERLQKEADELVQGKEKLEQEITKMKSSNVVLQKRLKETKDQKAELEERIRHLQFSQSQQQQQQPCSHHHEGREGEQSPAAARGKGEEIESQPRKQQQAEREQQGAWAEGMREEQQRLQNEAAYYQQQQKQPLAMAQPQAGHQQIDPTYFQDHLPRVDQLQDRQAAVMEEQLATGGRVIGAHPSQPAYTSPNFHSGFGDSQGPQSITFGSYDRSSFDHSYKSQMSAEAPAAIGSYTPLHEQGSSASWKQKKHQTQVLGSVAHNPQAAPLQEHGIWPGWKATEHNTDLPPPGVQSRDMSSGQLVAASSQSVAQTGSKSSPTPRHRLHDCHAHEPSPGIEQTTGFSAQDFLAETGVIEREKEAEKLRAAQSGKPEQEHSVGEVYEIPLDPNLVCPKCKRGFRHGEIQRLKIHFESCVGQEQ